MVSTIPDGASERNPGYPAAREYLARGFVPNPTRGKKPVATGWPELTLASATARLVELWPRDSRYGVGLVLGAPSGGLLDVDKDCPEARRAAPILLPLTEMIWGRQSAPDSHSGYLTADPPQKASEKYLDPVTKGTLVELRSTGGQTVVPPTLLPLKSGDGTEPVVWRTGTVGTPAPVNTEDLRKAVATVAATALLARYWPGAGARHAAALALCGGLVRADLAEPAAERIVRALCAATGDDETDDRLACVASTFAAHRAGANITGWPSLAEHLGEKGDLVTRAVMGWLGCASGAESPNAATTVGVADPSERSAVVDDVELTAAFDGPSRTLIVARRAGTDLHRHALNLNSAPARDKFAKTVVDRAWPDPDQRPADVLGALGAALLAFAAVPPEPARATTGDGPATDDPRTAALEQAPGDVRAEAEALLRDPDLVARIATDIATVGVVGERDLALTLYLVGTSAQLDKPVSAIVTGSTSSGKSYTLNLVASMFPPEVTLHATSCSPNALYYVPNGVLRHRWVIGGERSRRQDDDAADATKQFREMIETGRLTKLVAQKDESGNPTTRTFAQEGPIAFAESTTLENVFDEDANRCVMLPTTESEEQTRAVLAATAARAAGAGPVDVAQVLARHHAIQRMVPRCGVVVPFASRLVTSYPADRVDARRSFRHLLQFTRAVALLHFSQRDRDAQGRVIATPQDYGIAAALLARPLSYGRGTLSDGARAFWTKLAMRFPAGRPATANGLGSPGFPGERGTVFTSTDAYALHANRATVKRYLNLFEEAGLIKQVTPPKGRTPAEWARTGVEPSGVQALPTLDPGAAAPAGPDLPSH